VLSVAVLISGGGSNLRALLDAASEPGFPARVTVVGADREADGLAHAEEFGIPSFTVPFTRFASRDEWGAELAEQLDVWAPDLIVLSGLMRLLPPDVVARYAPRIVNTHPAYLPEFPGAHGVRDALAAGATQTGASVIVVDDGVDTGPVIAQERVPVLAGDDEHTLHERIKPVERRLLIDTVRRIALGELDLSSPPSAAPATTAP
jgi:phosphoribosylglycinamide formyltransferase 1